MTKGLGPKDALRIITQGFPREFLTNDPALDDPHILARRLVDDHAFRDQVIERMRSLEGAYEGLESIVNPFVAIALKIRREQGSFSANRQLLMRVSFINGEYLCIRERHYRWIKNLLAAANKAEDDNETDYDLKKREAFQHPDTWLKLWNATQGVIVDLLEQARTPTLDWAHKVADITLFTVMLLYPMRREQFNMMLVSPVEPGQYADSQLLLFHRRELAKKKELKANFHADTYEITFSKIETKNDKAIHYVIPERGRGELARKLIDVYLTIARPLMLQGRKSPYMFVPQKRNKSGIHLRITALNDILPSLCKKYFAKVLPPALMHMNPHLIRHVVASYALVIRKSLALAAMLLNDEPETVLSNYSDVLQSSKEELRRYHELDDDAPLDQL